MKKEKPLLKDLQHLVTSNYSRHWKGIGIELDITIDRIICIEKSHPTDLPSCCNEMLIHWYQSDERASWNKIIKAIDIVATSNKNYSCSLSSSSSKVHKTREAVSDLAYRLKEMSKNSRYKADLNDDNLPVATPKHFTSVALIHHKGKRTKREVLAIANLQKRGNFDLDKIHTDGEYFKQSNCSKNISDIFAKVKCADGTTKCPGIILIEGVPGIGKTVLSKEIVFQWAKGQLLSDHALVFLIPLRDPESQKINSVESFINYFGYTQVTEYIVNYIIDNKGKDITIVFDGYDELSEKLRNDSFLYKMMTQNVIQMPLCNVVITSRPNVSARLQDKVDLRVEILGFTNEDRKAYIIDALNGDNDKIDKVMTYLNSNPAINAYCYIPLNMTILLSFFQNDDTDVTELPNTQTRINEKFICTTISRYIRIKGLELNFSNFSTIQAPCDDHEIGTPCVGHEKGVPYGRIFKEISKLAFKALEKDKIVFTTDELQETCPCLESQSENWNGLGLLKPVQLFTVENILRNVSFNFLHFSIQEILAAYHITLMSEADQLKCMKQTFWENRYYNTWIMYVGLTKNQLPITFKHFLSGNWFLLHTRFLNWWNNDTYVHIKRPIINDKVKCLYLFQCFSEAENIDLCQYVGQLLQENEIDLSGQTLSAVNILTISSFLTRSTTRHWKVLNLSECFIGDDNFMQLHNSFTSNNRSKVCIDTLNISHNNLTQSSLEFIAGLILEWNVKNITFNDIDQHDLIEEVMHQVMQHPVEQLNGNLILCNFNKSETIFAKLSGLDYLIMSFGYTSNIAVDEIAPVFKTADRLKIIIKDCKSVKYLNLGANILQFKMIDLPVLIKNNKLIEYLYMPKVQYPILNENIDLEKIFDALKSNELLKYIDMSSITIDSNLVKRVIAIMESNRNLKDMKVSKLLLRCDDFQYLKAYLVKVTALQLLSITDYTFATKQDLSDLLCIIKNIYNIQQLNLSNCKIEILGANIMTSNAKLKIVAMFENDGHFLSQEDLRIIIQAMQTISSLKYVDFSTNEVNDELANDVATLFVNNSELTQINCETLALKQGGFEDLKTCLVKFKGLKYISITDSSLYEHDVALLKTFIYNNREIKELVISNCKTIIDDKVTKLVTDDGVFNQLEILELSNNSTKNIFVRELPSCLYCSPKLKEIILCNCYQQPGEIKQILMVLKYMRHLETVDLSGNDMTDDSVSDMEAMIVNNKQLQKLYLANCILSQTSLKIIIQALHTVSSLQCVDFSTNEIKNNLAGDLAFLITNNNQLELKFSKLTLNQSGFDHLNNHLVKIKGLIFLNITHCNFTEAKFAITNYDTQELNLSNCKILLDQLLSYISSIIVLNCLNLSNCHLRLKEIKQVFSVLKQMRYLQHIDLSGNDMTDDSVSNMEAMIVNNKQLQRLFLPNCILSQASLRIIIQAMHTASLLEYVDFSTNEVDDGLASDIAALFASNNQLKRLYFAKLTLQQSGFQHLKNCLNKIEGLKSFSITSCNLQSDYAAELVAVVHRNTELKNLKLSNCKIHIDQLLSILSCNIELKWLTLSNCMKSKDIKQILGILKKMKYLQHIDLSGNDMTDDSVSDMEAMIVNNKQLQRLFLPNCVLTRTSLRIIIQAMCTVSLLEYVDFSTNEVDDRLASDIAALFASNNQLNQLYFAKLTLQQSGFQHLKKHLVKIKGVKFFSINGCNFQPKHANQLIAAIHEMSGLKYLNLSNCDLHLNEIKQVFSILKQMRYLQHIDLSGNTTNDDSVSDMEAMIVNNKQLQKLCLPNCVLTQTSLKIIIQAMHTASLLEYVDFSTNEVDDGLASNIAALVASNNQLKRLYFAKLTLQQSGFQELKNCLNKIKGLKSFSITSCNLQSDYAAELVTVVHQNSELKNLKLSNCKIHIDQLLSILSCNIELKWLTLSNCMQSKDMKQILGILKKMRYLQHIDLSGNDMTDDSVSDMEAMIVNNKQLQRLCLPNCILSQASLRIIIRAMCTASFLKYVDFSTNEVDDGLASNIADLFAFNNQLKRLYLAKLTLQQSSFQQLKKHLVKIKEVKFFSINGCNFQPKHANQLIAAIHEMSGLKYLNLSNCDLHLNEIKQVFSILKQMRYLQHIDLSGNTTNDDSVSDMEAMIVNNKQLQKLCLPNCVLTQTSLKIIIQAMHTASLLEYVDFSTNEVDDGLASNIAALVASNNQLKRLYFAKLTLQQSGFQELKNCLNKIEGLKSFSITSCNLQSDYAAELVTVVHQNSELKNLKLSNCKIHINQLLSILSCNIELKWLTLSNCMQSKDIKQILGILKKMRYLQYIDLSGNDMTDESVSDMEAMIVNNKRLQRLCLPNCVLTPTSLKIIIQAMCTVSLLEYVDFSTNEVNDELASDIVALFTSNNQLNQLYFAKLILQQSGFQHLKKHLVKIKEVKFFSINGCSFQPKHANQLIAAIHEMSGLKYLNLSNCDLHLNEIKQVFSILKQMRYLQHIDLSGNTTNDDSVSDMEAMIVNNKQLQKLCLPNCVLTQTSLKIIIKAMHTVSLLEYVDFSTNEVDDGLASNIAALVASNNQLKRLYFAKLTLQQSGFQELKNCLKKIEGLKSFSITSCNLQSDYAAELVTVVHQNSELKNLKLSNCKIHIDQLLSILSCNIELKWLTLSNCMQSKDIKQILGILKKMRYLQYINLSGNDMTDESVSDMEAMIVSNKRLQRLCLPNCVLTQTSLRTIIRAMHTASLLEYVDFSTNEVDDGLASNIAALVASNNQLKRLYFAKLTLQQSGFQELKNCLNKIKGLKSFSITSCNLQSDYAAELVTVVHQNSELKNLKLSNCKIHIDQLLSILSCNIELKWLTLSNCMQSKDIKQILGILKKMRYLQHIDLSGNDMTDESVSDMEAMIVNNKRLQRLCLPNCVLTQTSLRIIIRAMRTASLLEYVDFNTNEVDDGLASNIAALVASNNQLKRLYFAKLTLQQSGFQELKNCLKKIEGLKSFSITSCNLQSDYAAEVVNVVHQNSELKNLKLSNCKIHIDQLLSILSCNIELKWLTLSNCMQSKDIKQILGILKNMRYLQHIDLSGNDMTDDSVSDMEAMIVNNKHLQRLCLPNCILSQASFRIICQALQSLSSLQYVYFGTNKFEWIVF